MLIKALQYDCHEADGFRYMQPRGSGAFTLFFFRTQVDLELQGTVFPLQPGGCIIYAPEAPQFFTAHNTLVYSRLDATEDIAPLLLQYHLPLGQPFYMQNISAVTDLLEKSESEFLGVQPYREDALNCCVQMLLVLLSRSLENPLPQVQIQQDLHLDIRNIRQHVLSNPQRKWTVAEMAQMMSLSPSRFHAVYKEIFGTAPMRDVIEARIGYAKTLLLDKKHFSLPQIADMLGYNDQYHFIRQFRTETGITPGNFRKNHR